MASTILDRIPLEQYRRFYAEEIRVVADIKSQALINAFARVPREQFLGPPPWQLSSGVTLQPGSNRSTSEIRDLYHDVLVVLKKERSLNNGQPSLIARFLAALDLDAGKRVIHIGCGTGYYTALIAETVGASGTVVAVDVDSDLAARAAANLGRYANVKVLHQDGATVVPGPSDAILINAGVTQLPPAWLDSLNQGGVLVVPLLVGRTSVSSDALAIRILRKGKRYAAELVTVLTIYPSTSLRDPEIQSMLNAGFESHDLLRMRSVRVDAHDRADTCIVHTDAYCLSSEAVSPESPFGSRK